MQLIVMFITTFLGGWIFPWWWPAVPAYVLGFWRSRTGTTAFLMGFFGTAGSWAMLAGWLNARNHGLLAMRIADLMKLPAPWLLLVLTGATGGLIGALSGWSGHAMGKWFRGINPKPIP